MGKKFETNKRAEIEKFERQIKAAIDSRESIMGMLKNSALKFREACENELADQVGRENSMKENIQKLKNQLRRVFKSIPTARRLAKTQPIGSMRAFDWLRQLVNKYHFEKFIKTKSR